MVYLPLRFVLVLHSTRHDSIAAEDVAWNYAPSGNNLGIDSLIGETRRRNYGLKARECVNAIGGEQPHPDLPVLPPRQIEMNSHWPWLKKYALETLEVGADLSGH